MFSPSQLNPSLFFLSIYLSIHPSIYSSIYPSIHLCIYLHFGVFNGVCQHTERRRRSQSQEWRWCVSDR